MLLVSFFLLAGSAWAPPQQSVDEIVDHLRPGAWKMLGPLQSRNSKGARALLGNVKHMEAGQPWLGLRESYAGTDSSELDWMPLNLESMRISQDQDLVNPRIQAGLDSGIIDFRSLIPGLPGSKRATYLYRPVYANAESTTDVTFGAAGRLSLWWNGRFIFRRKAFDHLDAKSASFTLDLQPGLNHLLIEVVDESESWQFEMRSRRHIDVRRINFAVDLGVQHLLDSQLIDGSWPPYGGYPNGTDALAIYTLIHSGQSIRSEAVLKGLARLRNRNRAEGTYSAALELMAFEAGGDAQDQGRMEEIARRLIRGQAGNGMWTYGLGVGATDGDLSNTQYAALGLRAAVKAGIDVPQSTWESLTRAVLACREDGGNKASSRSAYGFGYRSHSDKGSPSMTAAGIGTLAICIANLKRSERDKLVTRAQASVESGIRWLDQNWGWHEGMTVGMSSYYYLYGLERAGGLTDRDMFGSRSWYLEGAEHIVDEQKGSGCWDNDASPLIESFALLFLRKATSRHALTSVNLHNDRSLQSVPDEGPLLLRVSLNQPNSLWIDSQTENFDEIARVVYWLQAPDSPWIRIEEMFENRFAIQHDFAQRGDWKIRADAQLNNGRMLKSGIIDFRQTEGISAERLAYVTEGEGNLVPSGSPSVEVSTNAGANVAQFLTDGLYATSWRCQAKDSQPQAEITFRRKRKASVLKLVMAPFDFRGVHRSPAPQIVEVTINDLPPKMLRMPTYLQEKAVMEFEEEISVKRIKLRVISVSQGQPGRNASVGFAEVELY